MKKNIPFFLVLLFLAITTGVFAQQNFTLYNMQRIPQSMYSNPALTPMSSLNIGFPAISSTYINLSNNGFRAKDIFVKGADDSLHITPANMISKLKPSNYLTTAAQIDLFSFGVRAKKHYFSFTAIEKVIVRFRYPKDFMSFIWEGNGSEGNLGREMKFNFGLDATHYREYGLGYSVELFDRLSLGVKAKYLYGMENIWTEKSNVSLTTDANTFAMTGKMDIAIHTAGIDTTAMRKLSNFKVGEYALGKNNRGFGADLGAAYKFNDYLTFSGSIIDLGYIKWNTDIETHQNTNPNAQFTFSGVGFKDFIKDTTDIANAFGKVIDSLGKTFNFTTVNHSYVTTFSPKFYLGANFNFTRRSNIGFLYYSEFFDKQYHPGFSFSFNTRAGRVISFSATYSILNRSASNVGMGLSFNLWPFQTYIVSDNILAGVFPMSTKNVNLRVGANLTFGKPKDPPKREKLDKPWERKKEPEKEKPAKKGAMIDTDHDSIPDALDACPDIFGLKYLQGCPDRDHDSIPDKDDECPDVPGLRAFHGCPDTDGDGIEDRRDSCPNVAGLPEFHGCPDTDGDGIEDKLDSCLTVAGLKIFNGCPDTDGDGVPDKDDECPNVAGSVKFHGCPDTDGDGIPDKDDECPDQAGLAMYLGCPDSDLDGVPDKIDECPDTYGSKENHGCPLVKIQEKYQSATLSTDEQEILKNAFEKLTFQSGKAVINPASTGSLDVLSTLMNANPNLKLHVSGHTDNVGSEASNKKLSENRAKAVKAYLVDKGIDASRLSAEGFGSSRPVADNKTAAGKDRNRRVELKFIK